MDPLLSLKNKVIIITGAGSGIGRECCKLLSEYRARIVAVDNNVDGLRDTVKEIKSKHSSTEIVEYKCDVTKTEEVESTIKKVIEKFGVIDGAVNNAGVIGTLAKTADYPEDLFETIVDVNIKGVFLCMKHELSYMQDKNRKYSIVNMSSYSGISGFRLNAPYAASKHAVIGLTRSTALEYSRSNVRINAVCPGPLKTPMLGDDEMEKKMARTIPMGRVGTTSEVALMVLWLLCDASSFCTGGVFPIDGGLSCL
eukprot:TRINITY_DN1030_c0_g2_i4.p1 TRINITY_DN1030_c0_g2~~TRINITY_DN1030_c0_g2_i4.p1  ORF type:complete len:254 (+),score=29.16 TRINITY_DN1030_c0_g2_i4:222-983(+)